LDQIEEGLREGSRLREEEEPVTQKDSAEKAVRDIHRKTRRKFSAEEKIRIVLEGLRGEESIASLCCREGIAANLYYRWSKEFLEAGKKRLLGIPSAKPPRPKSRTFVRRMLASRKS
jgi:transposase-like protein